MALTIKLFKAKFKNNDLVKMLDILSCLGTEQAIGSDSRRQDFHVLASNQQIPVFTLCRSYQ